VAAAFFRLSTHFSRHAGVYRGEVAAASNEGIAWRTDPLALLGAVVDGMGGERRDGQVQLATAVGDAIASGHHLLAEAPTGAGKSLAYLAPAVASGCKVVIATSTIALQAQLANKDLPVLQQHGALPFAFSVLKGRANYLCLAKLRAADAPDVLFEQAVSRNFSQKLDGLRAFAQRSETGDRTDISDDITNADWAAVSSHALECPGRADCGDGAECFAERARDRAHDASILVVNHALYCAHLASDGHVLPDHDVVIIDEAHAFRDNATNAFAAEMSAESLLRLAPMLTRAGATRKDADALREAAAALGKALDARAGTVEIGHTPEIDDALLRAAERLATASAGVSSPGDEYAKRAAQLANGRLSVLRRLAAPDADDVVWIEEAGWTRRLRIAPVAAGETIAHTLLSRHPVIAVSATLGGRPPFSALAHDIGFRADAKPGTWSERDDDGRLTCAAGRGYVALQTPSSFDWRTQGILYVAKDLPDPSAREQWVDAASDRICELVNAAGGRSLVLCTARANVPRFAEALRERTQHAILEQGDRDTGRLIADFLDDETSVLVGTRSFWAGIDAVGDACVLVVIDKIPFPVPDEPLHAARRKRATEAGLNAFVHVDLPAAALILAQGAGRLIRSATDRGVVAVLDRRLATKTYRVELLDAMPPLRRSIDLAETCAFLSDAVPATGAGTHI
jgi:ATP-dependent DNA helicase DinG